MKVRLDDFKICTIRTWKKSKRKEKIMLSLKHLKVENSRSLGHILGCKVQYKYGKTSSDAKQTTGRLGMLLYTHVYSNRKVETRGSLVLGGLPGLPNCWAPGWWTKSLSNAQIDSSWEYHLISTFSLTSPLNMHIKVHNTQTHIFIYKHAHVYMFDSQNLSEVLNI